jgi:hypothetical protein
MTTNNSYGWRSAFKRDQTLAWNNANNRVLPSYVTDVTESTRMNARVGTMVNIVDNTINIPSITTLFRDLPVAVTYVDASGPSGPSGIPILLIFTFPTTVGPMTRITYTSASSGSGVVPVSSQSPATGQSTVRTIPGFRGPNPATYMLTVTAGETYRGSISFPGY